VGSPGRITGAMPYLVSPLAAAPRLVRRVRDNGPRLAPPGGLNEFGAPKDRINNVRRPSSSAGEGPLLAQILDIDRGRHCLIVRCDCGRAGDARPEHQHTHPSTPTPPTPPPKRSAVGSRRDARALFVQTCARRRLHPPS
jgi:hypothetical protein